MLNESFLALLALEIGFSDNHQQAYTCWLWLAMGCRITLTLGDVL